MTEPENKNKTRLLFQNEAVLRSYLLGAVDPEQAEQIELLIIESDDEFLALLDRIEDDLLTDYLDNALTTRELESFKTKFIFNEPRAEKIRFFRALLKIARDER